MQSSRALIPIAVAGLLVGAFGLSADASGGNWFRLGGTNDAARTSTLVNHGPGPALRLESRPGSAPLRVDSSRRVAGLNADRVDGLHAEQLRTRGYVYRIGGDLDAGPWVIKSFPRLPKGHYLASFRVVASFDGPLPHDLSCWFQTISQGRVGVTSGHQSEPQMVLEGSAYVDGRSHVTFRILSGENYSILSDTSNDRLDSRVSFVQVAPIRTATTRYVP